MGWARIPTLHLEPLWGDSADGIVLELERFANLLQEPFWAGLHLRLFFPLDLHKNPRYSSDCESAEFAI